jgi:tRNA (guanine37-N1)-methyltransferase
MIFNIITIFPEILISYFKEGMVGRAVGDKIVSIKTVNPRKWAGDKHRTVDDSPYGGGAGMVMKVEPIYQAIKSITKGKKLKSRKVVLLSAKGKTWSQAKAREYAKLKEIVFVCGRYEGVDERVLNFIDEEISIGDYVLTGGELGAAVITDSVTRLLPGVLGNVESAQDESHTVEGVLEYPQYTRPEDLAINKKHYKVPEVLLSGDHAKIALWRKENAKFLK